MSCRKCGNETAENKPYCIEHLSEFPEVRATMQMVEDFNTPGSLIVIQEVKSVFTEDKMLLSHVMRLTGITKKVLTRTFRITSIPNKKSQYKEYILKEDLNENSRGRRRTSRQTRRCRPGMGRRLQSRKKRCRSK